MMVSDVMVAILVPIGFFATISLIVVSVVWGGVQAKREMNETMRRAIDAGQQLDPDVIGALAKPVRSAAQDLRSGIVLTALGVGLALVGGLSAAGLLQDPDNAGGFFIAALVVGSIGVGQLISARLRRDRAE